MALADLRAGLVVTVIFLSAGGVTAARADCNDLVQTFDRAVAARSVDAATKAAANIADDIVCGERADEFRAKLADFLLAYAGGPVGAAPDRDRAVETVEKQLETLRNWRLAAKLADYFAARRDKAQAYVWYERSVSSLSNTHFPATPEDRRVLMTKLSAAKSLVNDDAEGAQTIAYQAPTREFNGGTGGLFSKDLLVRDLSNPRGAEVVKVPAPINFVTNETRFTPVGEREFLELAAAIHDSGLSAVRLVGHADPRGKPADNMDLSHRRVEAVRDRLRQQGIGADFKLEWKGDREPFDVSVLNYRPSQEEIWQLDRRVEWLRDPVAQ